MLSLGSSRPGEWPRKKGGDHTKHDGEPRAPQATHRQSDSSLVLDTLAWEERDVAGPRHPRGRNRYTVEADVSRGHFCISMEKV